MVQVGLYLLQRGGGGKEQLQTHPQGSSSPEAEPGCPGDRALGTGFKRKEKSKRLWDPSQAAHFCSQGLSQLWDTEERLFPCSH